MFKVDINSAGRYFLDMNPAAQQWQDTDLGTKQLHFNKIFGIPGRWIGNLQTFQFHRGPETQIKSQVSLDTDFPAQGGGCYGFGPGSDSIHID